MVGLAILSGLRRGELFALRWHDIDEASRVLTGREAVYDGAFDTPKTEAGLRQIPLSEMALWFIGEWKGRRAGSIKRDGLVFSIRTGQVLSPNNVLRRSIFPACEGLNLPHATWLTFRRTYSSWSHDKGVPGKVVAQLMGHANLDTTLNVYTQVLDGALRTRSTKSATNCSRLFTDQLAPVTAACKFFRLGMKRGIGGLSGTISATGSPVPRDLPAPAVQSERWWHGGDDSLGRRVCARTAPRFRDQEGRTV
jgi:hypothetical protein